VITRNTKFFEFVGRTAWRNVLWESPGRNVWQNPSQWPWPKALHAIVHHSQRSGSDEIFNETKQSGKQALIFEFTMLQVSGVTGVLSGNM